MNSINIISNILKKNFANLTNIKPFEGIFIVLLLMYLLSNISTPYNLAPHVNTIYTYLSLIIIFILLFLNTNPLIAILFGISAVVFLQRSKKVDHRTMAQSDANRSYKMESLNTHLASVSLEEEIVKHIEARPENITSVENYNPVICDSHNASNI